MTDEPAVSELQGEEEQGAGHGHHHRCGHHEHGDAEGTGCCHHAKGWLAVMIVGAALGAVLALLLAPRPGRETRQLLTSSGRQALKSGGEALKRKERAEAVVSKLKEVVKQMEEAI